MSGSFISGPYGSGPLTARPYHSGFTGIQIGDKDHVPKDSFPGSYIKISTRGIREHLTCSGYSKTIFNDTKDLATAKAKGSSPGLLIRKTTQLVTANVHQSNTLWEGDADYSMHLLTAGLIYFMELHAYDCFIFQFKCTLADLNLLILNT